MIIFSAIICLASYQAPIARSMFSASSIGQFCLQPKSSNVHDGCVEWRLCGMVVLNDGCLE